MKNLYRHIIATIGCIVGLAVLLSGVHAKDLSTLSQLDKRRALLPVNEVRVSPADDGLTVKTTPDLHNHIDKQTLKSITDQNVMADQRSRQKHGEPDVFDEAHVPWVTMQLLYVQVAWASVIK
jgi:hypothetical protein